MTIGVFMAYTKTESGYNDYNRYVPDPDEQGETWEGMYNLLRCGVPRC